MDPDEATETSSVGNSSLTSLEVEQGNNSVGGAGGGAAASPVSSSGKRIAAITGAPMYINFITAHASPSSSSSYIIRSGIVLGEEQVHTVERSLTDLLIFRLAYLETNPYIFIADLSSDTCNADEVLAYLHVIVNNPALCDNLLTHKLFTTPQDELNSLNLPGKFALAKSILWPNTRLFGPTKIPTHDELKVERFSNSLMENEELRNEVFAAIDVVIEACTVARGFMYSCTRFTQRALYWDRLRTATLQMLAAHDAMNEASMSFETGLRDVACGNGGAVCFWPWTMKQTLADEQLRREDLQNVPAAPTQRLDQPQNDNKKNENNNNENEEDDIMDNVDGFSGSSNKNKKDKQKKKKNNNDNNEVEEIEEETIIPALSLQEDPFGDDGCGFSTRGASSGVGGGGAATRAVVVRNNNNNTDENNNNNSSSSSPTTTKTSSSKSHPSICLGRAFLTSANSTEHITKQTCSLDIRNLITVVTLMSKVDHACVTSSLKADEHFRESSEELKVLHTLLAQIKSVASSATSEHVVSFRAQIASITTVANQILQSVTSVQDSLRDQIQSVRSATHSALIAELSRWSTAQSYSWKGTHLLVQEMRRRIGEELGDVVVDSLSSSSSSSSSKNKNKNNFVEGLPMFSIENENENKKSVTTFGRPPPPSDISLALSLSTPGGGGGGRARKALNQEAGGGAELERRLIPNPVRGARRKERRAETKLTSLDDPFSAI